MDEKILIKKNHQNIIRKVLLHLQLLQVLIVLLLILLQKYLKELPQKEKNLFLFLIFGFLILFGIFINLLFLYISINHFMDLLRQHCSKNLSKNNNKLITTTLENKES
uniref:Uncharacterized protein n=1 Tax=Meloidogyne enterolobii TaxID=390850 RepID=A0A6V7XLF5_MELEN|nr:unnamed protein product [Meloidogyne enterolobii]